MVTESHVSKGASHDEAQANVTLDLLVLAVDLIQVVFVGLVLDWLLFGESKS